MDLKNLDIQEEYFRKTLMDYTIQMLHKQFNLYQFPSEFFNLIKKMNPNDYYYSDSYAYTTM